ncbi:MAG: CapA family protein [Oscillospiraceae bacterium]|nr:CapA family protein [Oscillospiraceae bacterium]
MSKNPRRLGTAGTVIMTLLILALVAATGFVIYLCVDLVNAEPDVPQNTEAIEMPTEAPTEAAPTETTVPPTTAPPAEPETVIATATIATQGDLLMHSPVFGSAQQSDGSYNFENIFKYSRDLVASFDYAIANLETTFGGPEHPHVGNQNFCCPDALATNAKEYGYDMFLTANNHSGDSMGDGLIRTLDVTRAAGLATLGSQYPGENRYSIVEINGIKIGMVAYTWAFSGDGSKFSLNGLLAIKDEGQMNYFTKQNPDKLYNELGPIMEAMKAEGAEATMLFIHWGEEYDIHENEAQRKMAQKICDIGFDVIVGGHAHVVQPMALLESTVDPGHKTMCIYSLGNAVSNQRTGVSDKFPRGYTEDGMFFTVTFEKYSDGKVYPAGVDVIPTWVNMHSNNGKREYNILPLLKDQEGTWQETFQMKDDQFNSAVKSWDRTMGVVGEGLEACRNYLAQAKADREQYYYDLAHNPEMFATEAPAEPVETTLQETVPAA